MQVGSGENVATRTSLIALVARGEQRFTVNTATGEVLDEQGRPPVRPDGCPERELRDLAGDSEGEETLDGTEASAGTLASSPMDTVASVPEAAGLEAAPKRSRKSVGYAHHAAGSDNQMSMFDEKIEVIGQNKK